MNIKTALAILLAAGATLPTGALAFQLNGHEFSDSQRTRVVQACQGLAGQANQSSTAETPPPEDNNSDPASSSNLEGLSFTLKDCRDAGLV